MRAVITFLVKTACVLIALDFFTTSILGLFFPEQAINIYRILYGVNLPARQDVFLLFKPWATFGISAGIIALFPVFNLKKYRAILWALIVFLGVRLLTRLFWQPSFQDDWILSQPRNLFHIGIILIALIILILGIKYLEDKR